MRLLFVKIKCPRAIWSYIKYPCSVSVPVHVHFVDVIYILVYGRDKLLLFFICFVAAVAAWPSHDKYMRYRKTQKQNTRIPWKLEMVHVPFINQAIMHFECSQWRECCSCCCCCRCCCRGGFSSHVTLRPPLHIASTMGAHILWMHELTIKYSAPYSNWSI